MRTKTKPMQMKTLTRFSLLSAYATSTRSAGTCDTPWTDTWRWVAGNPEHATESNSATAGTQFPKLWKCCFAHITWGDCRFLFGVAQHDWRSFRWRILNLQWFTDGLF